MKTLKKLLLFVSALSLSLSAIAAPKDMLKERRNIENFSKLVVNGAVKVFLTQGKEVSLIIEGKQEMIDAVATHSANGTLVIEPSNKDAKLKHKVSIFITVPNLEEVSIDAVAKVEMTTDFSCGGDFFLSSNGKASIEGKKITCSELSISMSGASECDLHFDAKNTKLAIGDASSCDLKGKGKSLQAKLSGKSSCDVDAKLDELTIKLSELSKMEVSGKTEAISGSVDGMSTLKLKKLTYKKSDLNSTDGSSIVMK